MCALSKLVLSGAAVSVALAYGTTALAQPWERATVKKNHADLVQAVRDIGSPTIDQELKPHLAEGHELRRFGAGERPLLIAKDIAAAVAPYRAAFPDIAVKPKRVLSNKRLVLVQSVTSGTSRGAFEGLAPTQRSVRAETLQLHWTGNGQIKSSEIFLAPEQLRLQAQRDDIPRAAPAPASAETFTKPDVKVTKTIVGAIYGAASMAMASRIAWAAGRPELAAPLLREVKPAELTQGDIARVKPFLQAFGPSSVSIDNLFVSGPYVIAVFTFKGSHNSTVGSFAPTGRKLQQEGIVVARVDGGAVTSTQAYFDQSLFHQQLRAP